MYTTSDTTFWQFFMPFHMVGSILLGVLALKTNSIEASDWLLENFHQSESGFCG